MGALISRTLIPVTEKSVNVDSVAAAEEYPFPSETVPRLGKEKESVEVDGGISLTGEEDMVVLAVLEAGIHYLGRLSELQAQFAKERSKADNSAS